jgi:hypothetical protein
MRKMIITISTCLIAVGAIAQADTTRTYTSGDPREQCLMATGGDWGKLGLTQEQIRAVNEIQSTCMQDCVAAKEGGANVSAVLDRHVAQLRKVLDPEQFERWTAWCAEKGPQ